MSNLKVFGNTKSGLGILNLKTDFVKIPQKIEFTSKLIKKVANSRSESVFLACDGSLYNSVTGKKIEGNYDPIEDISGSGFNKHFIAFSYTEKVYTWGNNTSYYLTGQPKNTTLSVPTVLKYFENISPKKITSGHTQQFLLSKQNDLYGFGYNRDCNLGKTGENYFKTPQLTLSNIENIFSDTYGEVTFVITTSNVLKAFGYNGYGQLGVDSSVSGVQNVDMKPLEGEEIKHIDGGYNFSMLLTESGKVYACGDKGYTSMQNKKIFQEISFFKDKNIEIDFLSCGYGYTIFLSRDLELFIIGESGNLGIAKNSIRSKNEIAKLSFKLDQKPISMRCGYLASCFLIMFSSSINSDFELLYSHDLTKDGEINGIKLHKSITQLRLETDFEEAKKLLETNYNNEYIEQFIKWLYNIPNYDKKIAEEICKNFGSFDLSTKSLMDDCKKYYTMEESKDFLVLIKDTDNEDDEDQDEEGEYIELPVHKLILLARSGLYREMFQTIQSQTNQVKDYSGKSIDSLEILFKYFYTEKIEITADIDPVLLIDELSDAVDYFQLSLHSGFNSEIERLKKEFNI
ncbi:hypothetical protein M0812_03534 [Anaeramoeba flamelloides]|uniref:BTB domain-containing protein n=1 Tax=Anaeramoeba flamelloides TaxID=1746091 RepID=A0AAV8AIQ4_9EUKA|nr:hypothetical protein M0812_03534 [Anaeramoeba flamelloides]